MLLNLRSGLPGRRAHLTSLTIFPADIAEMFVSQLAALPPEQKREVAKNLDATIDRLKKARTKFDAALDSATAGRPAPHCARSAATSAPHTSAMALCTAV